MAEYAAVAQVTNQTALVVQGNDSLTETVNTNLSWKVMPDSAYAPCSINNGERLHTYMVIGPGDSVRAEKYPWHWEQPDYKDDSWQHAIQITSPVPDGVDTDASHHSIDGRKPATPVKHTTDEWYQRRRIYKRKSPGENTGQHKSHHIV